MANCICLLLMSHSQHMVLMSHRLSMSHQRVLLDLLVLVLPMLLDPMAMSVVLPAQIHGTVLVTTARCCASSIPGTCL
jgi:hypothetical protein